MNFFEISDNSLEKRGTPWAIKTLGGMEKIECPVCNREILNPLDVITLQLEKNKGVFWPDVLGSGASYPLFIISSRVVDAWTKLGLSDLPIAPVEIVPPIPTKLVNQSAPDYFWVDGRKLQGAKLDFEASGFVDVKFCPECGTRTDDIAATFQKQHSGVYPFVFLEGSYSGMHLFTTDLSPTAFFCTDLLVKCTRENRLTNFRFIPVEWGTAYTGKALQY